MAKTVQNVVTAVKNGFHQYPSKYLSSFFFTLLSVYESLMKVKGDNSFKIQHKRKNELTSKRKLQCNLDCEQNIYKNAKTFYEHHK